jgi:hypothetical protein
MLRKHAVEMIHSRGNSRPGMMQREDDSQWWNVLHAFVVDELQITFGFGENSPMEGRSIGSFVF